MPGWCYRVRRFAATLAMQSSASELGDGIGAAHKNASSRCDAALVAEPTTYVKSASLQMP
jgi:hypothetical protein